MDKTCNIGSHRQALLHLRPDPRESPSVLEAVGKAKPAHFKGHYIKSVTLSSSQSPSVRIASTEYGKY